MCWLNTLPAVRCGRESHSTVVWICIHWERECSATVNIHVYYRALVKVFWRLWNVLPTFSVLSIEAYTCNMIQTSMHSWARQGTKRKPRTDRCKYHSYQLMSVTTKILILMYSDHMQVPSLINTSALDTSHYVGNHCSVGYMYTKCAVQGISCVCIFLATIITERLSTRQLICNVHFQCVC